MPWDKDKLERYNADREKAQSAKIAASARQKLGYAPRREDRHLIERQDTKTVSQYDPHKW